MFLVKLKMNCLNDVSRRKCRRRRKQENTLSCLSFKGTGKKVGTVVGLKIDATWQKNRGQLSSEGSIGVPSRLFHIQVRSRTAQTPLLSKQTIVVLSYLEITLNNYWTQSFLVSWSIISLSRNSEHFMED